LKRQRLALPNIFRSTARKALFPISCATYKYTASG
jgi:hypothetical protein